jgi:hypothetical protein
VEWGEEEVGKTVGFVAFADLVARHETRNGTNDVAFHLAQDRDLLPGTVP